MIWMVQKIKSQLMVLLFWSEDAGSLIVSLLSKEETSGIIFASLNSLRFISNSPGFTRVLDTVNDTVWTL